MILLPLLNVIFSTILIYGPKLYIETNNIIYLAITFITTNMLVYVIYNMLYYKYSVLITTVCGKVLPLLIISFLNFYIFKDEKLTFTKKIGVLMTIIGIFLLVEN